MNCLVPGLLDYVDTINSLPSVGTNLGSQQFDPWGQDGEANTCEVLASNALFRPVLTGEPPEAWRYDGRL